MIVTLNKLLKQDKRKNPLLLKSRLSEYKKKGLVFYEENITSLLYDEPFLLYYHLTPNHNSPLNAFPIPMNEFCTLERQFEKDLFLKEYFFNYYGDLINCDAYFDKQTWSVYKGLEYAWFYISNNISNNN